ncbi:hypothetical protein [Shouchella patagoniensis]|uniref:hypothetical protein n=1 Tax=Shouchella patagoniensis TaxID=228576 RepID=UPI000995178E|nr:hypothetical protein [Shouchella patagoniensis]
MNPLSHSLSNHPSNKIKRIFHEEQMMRGHVLKLFPIAETAQIQVGQSIIVANLQAELKVGKVYWFTVVGIGYAPILKKIAEGGTFRQLLEIWSIYPSQKAMQLVALFERLNVPLQKKIYIRVTTIQRKWRASMEEVELTLCYLNEKRISFTDEWIVRSLVEIRSKKSVSATIRDIHLIALKDSNHPLIQQLDNYQKGEEQLKSDLLKAGPLNELLKRQILLIRGLDEIIVNLKGHELADSVKELQARLMLQIGPDYETKDFVSVVMPFSQIDWDIQISNEKNKPLNQKIGQKFHAMISTFMPKMGSLRMSIRLKEKRVFLVIYSHSTIPESFCEARERLKIKLRSKGFELEVCKWIDNNSEQTRQCLHSGIDIKL